MIDYKKIKEIFFNGVENQLYFKKIDQLNGISGFLYSNNLFVEYFWYSVKFLLFPIYTTRCLFVAITKCNRQKIEGSTIYLYTSIALPRVVKNADVRCKDFFWLLSSSTIDRCNFEKSACACEVITKRECFCSWFISIWLFYLTFFRYGLRCAIIEYNTFDWVAYAFALKYVKYYQTIIFCNHKDRWACLFDYHKSKNKILVQHGTEIIKNNPNNINNPLYVYDGVRKAWYMNVPHKFSQLSLVYTFSDDEFYALKNSILNCNPRHISVGYELKLTDLGEHPALLIIGFYRGYYKNEEEILKLVQGKEITVYLKNHPSISPTFYDEFIKKYDFKLINEPIFPKVEMVVSYDSTLALQYSSIGSPVFYYGEDIQKHINEIFSNNGK